MDSKKHKRGERPRSDPKYSRRRPGYDWAKGESLEVRIAAHVSLKMRRALCTIADERELPLSEVIRQIIEEQLAKAVSAETA